MNRWKIRLVGAATLALVTSATILADGTFDHELLLMGKQRVEGSIVSSTSAKELRFETGGSVVFTIPFQQIKALHYERAAKPRYAAGLLIAWPLLFTKSKQHYLTVQYADGSGEGKFQIVQLDKNNFRMALDSIEADTGIKIDRSEER